jgi:hypothetical protein
LVIGLAGAAQAGLPPGYTGGAIDTITVANADVSFGPGGVGSTLALDAHTGLTTVYYDPSGTNTFSADFDLDTFLANDWSSGGLADGYFTNGSWALAYGGDNLLAGNVQWYRVAESQDNPGVLIGVGALINTAGLLVNAGDWPAGDASTSSIMFMLDIDPDNFGSPFTGSAMVNLAPDDRYIPEPMTALLLVGGLLAIRRRK